MFTLKRLWRPLALASGVAAVVAFAAFGSASASAATVTAVFSSGATIQNQLQSSILIPDWTYGSNITWTSTSAGDAFKEFGNTSGTLDPTQDPTADPTKSATGTLDAYVATDSPPTGPLATAGTNLYEAEKASGTDEVTVPLAQTPIDVVLSLPLKVMTTGKIDLTNELTSQAFAGTVPKYPRTGTTVYNANTWGALLSWAGASFTDEGGGTSTIKVELRKNGAGATQTIKDYLFAVDKLGGWTDWKEPAVKDDDNAYTQAEDEWPSGASILPATEGNSSDTTETTAVWNTPGTIGYDTAGDAAAKFSNEGALTGKENQEVAYAEVQDNGVAGDNDLSTDSNAGTAKYADPENGSSGNVYTEAVQIVGDSGTSGDPESWTVPFSSGTTLNPEGSWYPTEPDDPSISTKLYPIVAVLYGLAWEDYSGLTSWYPNASNAGYTAQQFLEFATSSTGQSDIGGSDYYAELPSNILGYGQTAAAAVDL